MADKYKVTPMAADNKVSKKFHKIEGLDRGSNFFKNPIHALRFMYFAFANSKFYDAWRSGRLVIQFQIIDTRTWSRISDIHNHSNKACVKDLDIEGIMPNDMDSFNGFVPAKGKVKDALAELLKGKKSKNNLDNFLDELSSEIEEEKDEHLDIESDEDKKEEAKKTNGFEVLD